MEETYCLGCGCETYGASAIPYTKGKKRSDGAETTITVSSRPGHRAVRLGRGHSTHPLNSIPPT
jgi:hypothetical protein